MPFAELSNEQQSAAAERIAVFTRTHEADGIIPVEPAEILKKQLGVIALDGDTIAGYVGASPPIAYRDHLMSSVGSLCVWPDYEGQGLATELVGIISGELQAESQTPFAFCNPDSIGSFERVGYAPPELAELPPEAVSTRGNQPMILEV